MLVVEVHTAGHDLDHRSVFLLLVEHRPVGPNMSLGNPASAVSLTEAGSSLLYSYLKLLPTPLQAMYSKVALSPAAGGSGKGISDAIAGTTQLGGSDAYLSSAQTSANPGLLNIPIAVSSQAVNCNLPGIKDLKLTGDVLARMYEGSITRWNDAAITALNPGVTMPAKAIVPVRRVDSSGDTFIFTGFLSATNSTWSNGPSQGTTVSWPTVSNEETANGNPGMVQTCSATPGCVAYIGIRAESSAQAAGLGEASRLTTSESTVAATTRFRSAFHGESGSATSPPGTRWAFAAAVAEIELRSTSIERYRTSAIRSW